MTKVAVFASGTGTNAENLVKYFQNHPAIRVVLMVSDRLNAPVFERMKKLSVPTLYIKASDLENGILSSILNEINVDYLVLAGFLKLIPRALIDEFNDRIINIHPALLPLYGGKGMYGQYIHEAVINAGDKKTGITVHKVNERFDEGEIIAQFETDLDEKDTPDSVATKIHELEMKYFPTVVENYILDNEKKS